MAAPRPTAIETTETLVRLYVFLTQYLDRCLDQAVQQSLPDRELQRHLDETRARMLDLLSVNPVVQGKVAQECERILSLGSACLTGGPAGAAARDAVPRERITLRNKTLALSDLLAVFRAQLI